MAHDNEKIIKNIELSKILGITYQGTVKKLNNPKNKEVLKDYLVYNAAGQIMGIYESGIEAVNSLRKITKSRIEEQSKSLEDQAKDKEIEQLKARIEEQSKTIERLYDQLDKKDDQITEYKDIAKNMAESYKSAIESLRQQNLLLTDNIENLKTENEDLKSQKRFDDAIRPSEEPKPDDLTEPAKDEPAEQPKKRWWMFFKK